MTLDEIKAKLQDRNLREVARQSGIPYSTLWSISRAKTIGKRAHATVQRLIDYLAGSK